MRVIRAVGALALCVLLGGWGGSEADAAAKVTGLRSSSASAHTRVVLDLTGPARHTHQVVTGPPRLILDVQGTLDPSVTTLEIHDDLVDQVRIGSAPDKGSRFVFDLKQPVDYRVMELGKDGSHPDRLVIDLFGTARPAPKDDEKAAVSPPSDERAAEAPPSKTIRRERTKPFVIMVDAGHGGQDTGAQGFSLDEKDVCLSIASRVVDELNRKDGFEAHLTRDGDYFIPLRKRIEIAEKKNADAFVSIHANASRSRSARGTEVYFLSLSGATDEASRELAHLENSADLIGGVAPEADDDLSSILFDMQQTDVQQKGSLLAESVVNSLRGYSPLLTRGVKQAGFVVLKSPRIPSILVETAFITHPQENGMLARNDFKTSFARRVVDGIVKYFADVSAADFH